MPKDAPRWTDPIPVGSYSYHIGVGVLGEIPARVVALAPKASVFVLLTDRNVGALYAQAILDGFRAEGRRAISRAVQPGEASKCRAHKEDLEDWMLAEGCARDTCVVTLGGGVVGDLGGFVAATFMRGVPFVQVPTSLLAMVDSSVGGKTGVDTAAGKNLVGAFYRPLAVLVDVAVLDTLPRRELCNGVAECIKHGLIASPELFELLAGRAAELLELSDRDLLLDMVHRSVRIKAEVVVRDEREGGLRAILNFGHSVGHAVESLMQPRLLHGECVAVGMVAEARLARQLGHLPSEEAVRRLERCCGEYSLPVALPEGLATEGLLRYLAVDKKNRAGACRVVMLTGLGSVRANPYTTEVGRERLAALLSPTYTVAAAPAAAAAASGSVAVPGSKSISNRALLAAALGSGTCRLRGLLHSDDTRVMLEALRAMGVRHESDPDTGDVVVHGAAGRLSPPDAPLFLKNAGTASRFLTSAVCLARGEVELTGNARMRVRPIGDLVDALRRCEGVRVDYTGDRDGSLPVRVCAPGGLPGGEVRLAASVSSQFVSSVLLSAPYAAAPTTLVLEGGAVVSEPYIAMTAALMGRFGVRVAREDGGRTYRVQPGGYASPAELLVEGDASSASYPLALAAATGGRVTVTNVGSSSTQGDAQFCDLLARMGCAVEQTESTTTVKGLPGGAGLCGLGTVDMGDMTDTFMTLVVLAALADGPTRIVNIGNQRVKECNRIAAMVRELGRLGAACRELPDGIEIDGAGGRGAAALRGGAVHCYDDHRIAMSFAVLGAAVPGVHVLDKACVGKTYPAFWDDMERCLGVGPAPGAWAAAEAARAREKAEARAADPGPPVFLVGMRGVGKSTLGRAAARALGRPFADLDEELERSLGGGQTIKQFVEANSWEEFRRRELAVLRAAAAPGSPLAGAVVACGGGVVETPAALELLRAQPLVVQLSRHIDDVDAYLRADPTRPQFAEPPRDVFARRLPLYRACSRHEFVVRRGDTDREAVARDLAAFLRTVLGGAPPLGDGTFFLSLTFARVADCVPLLPEVERGADALELRVDLLDACGDAERLADELALLRRHATLPVVWTVRTRAEGGAFGGTPEEAAALAALGLRLGCRLVDAEAAWPAAALDGLFARRGRQELIVSAHVPGGNGGSRSALRDLFCRCHALGRADVVKVVVRAGEAHDAVRLLQAERDWRATLADRDAGVRTIVLAMGEPGKLSRVLNRCLTPVTHPALPAAAAPGQLSAAEIVRQRQALGLLRPLRYCLFGTPVSRSPSPAMHNAGFARCELPHRYGLHETADAEEVRRAAADPDFGGASVTIPLKERVAAFCGSVSEAAAAIGAVNTLVRVPGTGELRGENTDWVGIAGPLRPLLREGSARDGAAAAVVVGAGGTARAALYALQQLGFRGPGRLHVANPRTPARAGPLAAEFGCSAGMPASGAGVAAVVCTLPGQAGYSLPAAWLAEAGSPAVVDVSYLPKDTPLQRQARAAGCPLVRGIDMLVAQGVEAFRLWTGRSAGVEQAMNEGARAFYDSL